MPNVRQQWDRIGNWLTRAQAKELLRILDRTTLKGKRDYLILANLRLSKIQQREGRWVLADLVGRDDGCARWLCRFR